MTKRKVPFNKTSIDRLPDDKPAVYNIKSKTGNPNYIGSTKRGQVQSRLKDHLPGGERLHPWQHG